MPSMHVNKPAGPSVAFRTVGCRLNQCETAQMQEALANAGFCVVEWDQPAAVRVVNTCTVTAKSDRTCRHELYAARRLDPDCLLAVTGCLAQVSPESVAAISGVDLVLGNPDKSSLAEHLATALQARAGVAAIAVSPYPEKPAFETEVFTHFHGRTRAFLKIQTGCDGHCAYCIVPTARGPARSMAKHAVAQQVDLLTAHGYREIVLTGIDLGSWGKDTGDGNLTDLLRLLLDETRSGSPRETTDTLPGRLRLSSIEPLELEASLLDLIQEAGDRMAHHFHLPLQSGSDSVLTRMRRPYSVAQYLSVTNDLARRLPDAAIGADVIVGFPGETDAEFEETLALVEAAPLSYLHVFAYSDRPGTAAASMYPKLPPEVIKERSDRLRRLGESKKTAFRDSLTGSRQRVLVLEEHAGDGSLVGLTGNYMEVLVPDEEHLQNSLVDVRLDSLLPDGRWQTTLLQQEP